MLGRAWWRAQAFVHLNHPRPAGSSSLEPTSSNHFRCRARPPKLEGVSGARFVTFAPLIGALVIVAMFFGPPWSVLRITGLAVCLVGMVFVTWARFELGESFSVLPKARRLVTTGVYSRVRHPVYVFSTLALVGLALYVDRPLLLWGLVVLVPAQALRAFREETVLRARFGEEYRQYRQGTWF